MKIKKNSESRKRGERLELFSRIIDVSPAQMISLMKAKMSWSQILRGKFIGSEKATLEKLVELYGLNVEWLLNGKGNPFAFLAEKTPELIFQIFTYLFTDKDTQYEVSDYVDFLSYDNFTADVLKRIDEKKHWMSKLFSLWYSIHHDTHNRRLIMAQH